MPMRSPRAEEIEKNLLAQFGAVICGAELRRILGYRTGNAFRQAVHRKTLPIRTFFEPHRRGRCAASADVAIWMASLQAESFEPKNAGMGGEP